MLLACTMQVKITWYFRALKFNIVLNNPLPESHVGHFYYFYHYEYMPWSSLLKRLS